MLKSTLSLFSIVLILVGCNNSKEINCEPQQRSESLEFIDSLASSLNWPEELEITGFAGPDLTPSPACIAVAPGGEVFVGVDMIGSLGKEPGKGYIVKLV